LATEAPGDHRGPQCMGASVQSVLLGAWGLGAFGALARCGFGVLRLGVASASVAPRMLQVPRVFKVSAWCPAELPVPAIGRTPTGKAQPISDPFRRRARLDRLERGKHSAPAPAEGGEPGSSQGID